MKKFIITLLIFCFFAMPLSACKNDDTINVYVPDGATAVSLSYMMANKTEINGKKIKYNVVPNSEISSYVLSKQADLAIMPVNASAKLYSDGLGYQLAAVMTHGNLFLVGTSGSSLEDIRGKRVGRIGQNNIPDRVFSFILAENEIDDTITTYFPDSNTAISNIIAGQIDFAVVAEPDFTDIFENENLSDKGIVEIASLQHEWSLITGSEIYPQASLIVKEGTDIDLVNAFLEFSKEGDTIGENNTSWAENYPTLALNTIKENMLSGKVSSIKNLTKEQIINCGFKTKTDNLKKYVEDFFEIINISFPNYNDGFYF